MIDPARLQHVLRRGGEVGALVERFRGLDERRRDLQRSLDELRAARNGANQRMAAVTDKKSPEFAAERDALRELSNRIKAGETELGVIETDTTDLLMRIPNAPHETTPDGTTAEDNPIVSTWGEKPTFSFAPKAHWEVGEALGILDFEAAAKISGTRFCVLRGAGARLSRALISFMVDTHVERGYTEVWPPVLVRRHAMEGTGQLPKFENEAFKTAGENEFFLAPTAEVPVTNLHREEILEPGRLP